MTRCKFSAFPGVFAAALVVLAFVASIAWCRQALPEPLTPPAGAHKREHCRVTGQVLPQIRFAVSLPTVWNRRFHMFGKGGYAGNTTAASTTEQISPA
jgi:hypothetical protein